MGQLGGVFPHQSEMLVRYAPAVCWPVPQIIIGVDGAGIYVFHSLYQLLLIKICKVDEVPTLTDHSLCVDCGVLDTGG